MKRDKQILRMSTNMTQRQSRFLSNITVYLLFHTTFVEHSTRENYMHDRIGQKTSSISIEGLGGHNKVLSLLFMILELHAPTKCQLIHLQPLNSYHETQFF